MVKIKHKKLSRGKDRSIRSSVAETFGLDEPRLFSIGFKYFNDGLCVLKSVDIATVRKVHEVYRNIGKCTSIVEMRKLPHDIKPIRDSGHYAKYFKRLTEDTEVQEFDAGRCRGFFFCDNTNKVVQMLAIDQHPEDRKNRG